MKKKNKNRKLAAIITPIVCALLTIILFLAGDSSIEDIKKATRIEDGKTVGGFINAGDGSHAIYTGSVSAVDPVYREDLGGIYYQYTVNETTEKWDSDEEKWIEKTKTVSDEKKHCRELQMDDVVIPYSVAKSLPVDMKHKKREDRDYYYKETPKTVDGTFLIEVKDGAVRSAKFYDSEDVAGKVKGAYSGWIVFIWIVGGVVMIVMLVQLNKGKHKRPKRI